MKYLLFLLFLLLKAGTATAQNNLVVNGIPWFDDKGNIVNAHGCLYCGRKWKILSFRRMEIGQK